MYLVKKFNQQRLSICSYTRSKDITPSLKYLSRNSVSMAIKNSYMLNFESGDKQVIKYRKVLELYAIYGYRVNNVLLM